MGSARRDCLPMVQPHMDRAVARSMGSAAQDEEQFERGERVRKRGVFFYSSQELKEQYDTDTRLIDDEWSLPQNPDLTAEVMERDLGKLVESLFAVFMGSKRGMIPGYRFGNYFSLQFWNPHRALGAAERRRAPCDCPVLAGGDALAERVWAYDDVIIMLDILRQALSMANMAQAAELDTVADLDTRYPELLKQPRAPNSPRDNFDHAYEQLRKDAEQARGRLAFVPRKSRANPDLNGSPGTVMLANYRFSHPHLALIPYNWALHLFDCITQRQPLDETGFAKYPPDLRPELHVAMAGFEYMHGHGDANDTLRRRRISTATRDDPYYILHLDTTYGCPKPFAEIRWLEAFVACVDWMRQTFPDAYAYAKRVCFSDEPAADVIRYKNAVMSAEDYENAMQTMTPKEIARHLLLDADVCENKGGNVDKEERAIQQEALLEQRHGSGSVVYPADDYKPRLRGGTTSELANCTRLSLIRDATGSLQQDEPSAITPYVGPSSWVQKLADIPYPDFISAHSVNTFAPLILIRELAPIMSTSSNVGLQGHIVNMSSREGIFEARRGNTAKRGRHVHTNMSKAGLNKITETEAETLWKERRIAMNTVDPGYMSAAPECDGLFGGERPISWDDGAGRVLWPIYRMEEAFKQDQEMSRGKGAQESGKYWGRFFKHYGATRVEPRFGRG
ncbi:hypothetical protein PWT90_01250 [Aphanocladium album]|nr:hypothetical protein PWT90_01250 [Aphanocladium album]